MRSILLFAAMIFSVSPAIGQDIPAQTSVLTPDLSSASDANAAREGWKYFFFFKQGVSYEEAYLDFADCYRFLPTGPTSSTVPMFAPWRESAHAAPLKPSYNYGLVGHLIGRMLVGPMERRARQSRMRRCMEPRGYVRYPIARDAWDKLIDNYSVQSIALQAKAASGPRPIAAEVTQ